MDDIIIRVIELFVVILAALIGRYLIPTLKVQLGTEKFNEIAKWARVFVSAAENIYNEPGMGEKKRETVMRLLISKADEIGLTVTEDQIRAILESALAELKNDGVIK